MKSNSTRRAFLGTSLAAAGWMAARPYVANAAASHGPNDTVNLALIGCGKRGQDVMGLHMAVPGVRMVAVCDVNEERLALGVKKSGNDNILQYRDYRKLMENKDIDAVIVATTGHWHVLPTIRACQAGKDVYVEKPLGTSIGEGRAAVKAARKYDRVVQFGTQQRSWEHYQRAAEFIQAGKLGDISEVKVWDYDYFYPGFGSPSDEEPPKGLDWDFWLGPSPKRPYNRNRYLNNHWFFDYGGGWQLDWAVHHYDIVHWCLGVTAPVAASASGGFYAYEDTNVEWPDTFSGVCEYGPGPVAKKGFLLQYTFRGGCRREHRSHCKIFHGSEASMILDRSGYTVTAEARDFTDANSTFQDLGKNGRAVAAEARGTRRFGQIIEQFRSDTENHAQVFIDCVRAHKRSPADVEIGHCSSNPGHLMNIAWRVGRKIRWDSGREQVINDVEANALVTKNYCTPWNLDV